MLLIVGARLWGPAQAQEASELQRGHRARKLRPGAGRGFTSMAGAPGARWGWVPGLHL